MPCPQLARSFRCVGLSRAHRGASCEGEVVRARIAIAAAGAIGVAFAEAMLTITLVALAVVRWFIKAPKQARDLSRLQSQVARSGRGTGLASWNRNIWRSTRFPPQMAKRWPQVCLK